MEPELFTPSIDWAAAPLDSLRWIAMAWVISAVCLLVVLVVLALCDGVGSAVLAHHRAATSSGRSRFGCG